VPSTTLSNRHEMGRALDEHFGRRVVAGSTYNPSPDPDRKTLARHSSDGRRAREQQCERCQWYLRLVIVTMLILVAAVVFVGSFAWDRLHRRRRCELAARTPQGSTLVEGVPSAAAVESVLHDGFQGNTTHIP
jgi:uracil-DNA glycosylase